MVPAGSDAARTAVNGLSMSTTHPEIPRSTSFPLLPLRTGVLFPGTTITLPIGRERSSALVQTLSKDSLLVVAAQRDPREENPTSVDDLHTSGTFARVVEISRPRGERAYRLVIEGVGRVDLRALDQVDPF